MGNFPTAWAPAAEDQVTAGIENMGGITYCGGMPCPPLPDPGYAITSSSLTAVSKVNSNTDSIGQQYGGGDGRC